MNKMNWGAVRSLKTRNQSRERGAPKVLKVKGMGLKGGKVLSSLGSTCLSPRERRGAGSLWEFSPDRQTNVVTEVSSTFHSTHSNWHSSKGKKKRNCSELPFNANANQLIQSPISITQLIEGIKEKIVTPIKTQIGHSANRTRNINRTVDNLLTHVSSVSEDLSKSIISNRTFLKERVVLSFNLQETLIENRDLVRDITEIKREIGELLNERLLIEQETTVLSNECLTIRNEIASIRETKARLCQLSDGIQNDKKVLTSALMLVMKRILSIKESIGAYQKKHSNVEGELLMLIN